MLLETAFSHVYTSKIVHELNGRDPLDILNAEVSTELWQ